MALIDPVPPGTSGPTPERQVLAWGASAFVPVLAGVASVLLPQGWGSPATAVLLLLLTVLLVTRCGDRFTGTGASVVAAVVYDVAWTAPQGSLVVHAPADVATVGLLLLTGVVLSHLLAPSVVPAGAPAGVPAAVAGGASGRV